MSALSPLSEAKRKSDLGAVRLAFDHPQRTRAGVSLIRLCVRANPDIGSRRVFDDRQALARRPGLDLST